MKLKLVAAISALAIPALAHAQQGGPQPNIPKPTKTDVQNVVQIVTTDKVKTQAYCDLTKLYDQIEAAEQKECTQGAATNSKAAEPGRPTALHRTAWEGSSDLVSLSCVEKGRRPGPTRKAYAPKRLFLRRWSFCS